MAAVRARPRQHAGQRRRRDLATGGPRSRPRRRRRQPAARRACSTRSTSSATTSQNQAVPDKDMILFIPFRFSVFAAATTMTRDEFVTFMTNQALQLRANIIASVGTANAGLLGAAGAGRRPDRASSISSSRRWSRPASCCRSDGMPPIRTAAGHPEPACRCWPAASCIGPAGSVDPLDRQPARLLRLAAHAVWQRRTSKTATLDRQDPRQNEHYFEDIPLPALPTFADYDQHLSHADARSRRSTSMSPWVPFEDRGAGLPADFQINGPAPVGADPFAGARFQQLLPERRARWRSSPRSPGRRPYDTAGFLPASTAAALHGQLRRTTAGATTYVNQVTHRHAARPGLDPSTFQLGDIKIGDITHQRPGRQSRLHPGHRLHRDPRLHPAGVRRASTCRRATPSAKWVLQAIDPLTGEVLQDPTPRPADAQRRAGRRRRLSSAGRRS